MFQFTASTGISPNDCAASSMIFHPLEVASLLISDIGCITPFTLLRWFITKRLSSPAGSLPSASVSMEPSSIAGSTSMRIPSVRCRCHKGRITALCSMGDTHITVGREDTPSNRVLSALVALLAKAIFSGSATPSKADKASRHCSTCRVAS